jgi:hypothetical protein
MDDPVSLHFGSLKVTNKLEKKASVDVELPFAHGRRIDSGDWDSLDIKADKVGTAWRGDDLSPQTPCLPCPHEGRTNQLQILHDDKPASWQQGDPFR